MRLFTPLRSRPGGGWLWQPGAGPVNLRICGHRYVLQPPEPRVLIDIAADYAWWELIPGAFIDGGDDLLLDRLRGHDRGISLQLLHYAAQQLGQALYGWPFFAASRICATTRFAEPAFRVWAVTEGVQLQNASAVDWCAAGVAWMYAQAAGDKTKTQQVTAVLQIPRTLELDGPGVTPAWVAASER